MTLTLEPGDCRYVLTEMAATGQMFDSCVTDPPYHLTSVVKRFGKPGSAPAQHGKDGLFARQSKGFMGKEWDGGDVAFDPATWRLVWDVLKPGGHVLAFGGTRTFHRLAVAIEDAGFEIRDCVMWMYGTGFPKSHDVSKGIDAKLTVGGSGPKNLRQRDMGDEYRPHALAGTPGYGDGRMSRGADTDRDYRYAPPLATDAARQWQGWGTALKPAWEPVIVARKPLVGTVASNVMEHGTGALNIDGCRIPTKDNLNGGAYSDTGRKSQFFNHLDAGAGSYAQPEGRWPANVIHDGSDEVLAAFPNAPGQQGAVSGDEPSEPHTHTYGKRGRVASARPRTDSGSAARFFMSCKPGDEDWIGHVSSADEPFDLRSGLVVSVLDRAVSAATPGAALLAESYRARSTNVTATALREACGLVTETIRHFANAFSLGLQPGAHSLSSNHVKCAADPGQIGTMTITLSLSTSDGYVEAVTFKATLSNTVPGGPASPAGSRVFYSAKASKNDRAGSRHPTVKPVDLIRYLARLVTPPGGHVLDPFGGSGTLLAAAHAEGFHGTVIEMDPDYQADIQRRIAGLLGVSAPSEPTLEEMLS